MKGLLIAFQAACILARWCARAVGVAFRAAFLAALIFAAASLGALYAETRAAREGCGFCPHRAVERAPGAREV